MSGERDLEGEFTAYVIARRTSLLRAAVLLTGDPHSAEDLVQETLLRAASRWERIDPGAPDAYVRRILYSRSIDAWRWRRHQPNPVDTAGWERAAAATGDADLRLTLAAALRRLTPKQRAVLVLRFVEDRTETDTARVLGCSLGTVKSQTRHALTRLRALNPDLADLVGRKEPSDV